MATLSGKREVCLEGVTFFSDGRDLIEGEGAGKTL